MAAGKEAHSLRIAEQQGLEAHRPPTWDELGETFETMGKLSLALAVGMSAAALFCRLAEQGKIRVPSVSTLLVNQGKERRAPKN
ncbi:MAG: hypothetical protein WC314_15320 [Vulcanimicrobiota bacterium]